MNPRTRKALWILLGILLVACLFVAGPAHNVLHHGPQDVGGCDLCAFASPEAPRFERVEFWWVIERIAPAPVAEHVIERLLFAQGNARAPPAAG